MSASSHERPFIMSGHSSAPQRFNRRSLDGCGREAVSLAVEQRYDFPESGGYLGNLGLSVWGRVCVTSGRRVRRGPRSRPHQPADANTDQKLECQNHADAHGIASALGHRPMGVFRGRGRVWYGIWRSETTRSRIFFQHRLHVCHHHHRWSNMLLMY